MRHRMTRGPDHRHAGVARLAHRGEGGRRVVQPDLARDEVARAQPPGLDQREQLRVGARRHPVRAEQLELARDHEVHRHARRVGEEADLHVPPALAQPGDGGGDRRLGADGVDRDVGAAGGDVSDVAARADGHLRARPARRRQGLVGHVDADHARAQRRGDHHRRQPDAAAAVHGHPLARLRAADLHDRAVGGGEAAAEPGRRHGADRLRQRDQVDVGPVERDELGVRAPVREARLALAVADLLVAGAALLAAAARAHERDGHARARRPLADVRPDRLDHAGELVPRHVRERADVRVVAHPAVPVGAAQPGRLDADHHAVRRRRGVRNGRHLGRLPEPVVDDRAHSAAGQRLERRARPVLAQ